MLGVFLGIQVANWNVERETKQKSSVFTNQLVADLREESWRYQFLIEYDHYVRVAAENTANALSGKAPLDNETLLIHAYRASQYKQARRAVRLMMN